ncbi:RNA methyltransferase [Parendozoicomonas haliclonae]|uniref:tRNA (cytidine/uridine-2'-O-)-methyltransferase TrmJ n=1 Tax=Parendozoicomonas haliclonae TaxID=1960125 RepID=A0A1X7ADZ6_9GAMM|nr:RNA methyltransferase [Parendozoicomonas haliclonae]SMA33077.1 tRNA (cytidine/uridine-2'-O-)-methyltransferase TrmJ [Parendozoicomonas haliclonae]
MSVENIRIVLVNTTHPGNIGSAARAMKTMGLSSLYLVDPVDFPSGEARALSSGATDLLESAVVTQTLEEAIADCELVIGASARVRGISLELTDPRDTAQVAVSEASTGRKVALVFGREDRGLTNEELRLCHRQVHIPSVAEFSSLNLAASVQVLAYELRMTSLSHEGEASVPEVREYELASSEQMESFYTHLRDMLNDVGFFKSCNPEKIMAKLRRIYGRSRLDRMEYNIMRGILTETQAAVKNLRKPS